MAERNTNESAKAPHGRGAGENPANRFVPAHVERDLEHEDAGPDDPPSTGTQFLRDASRSALTRNDSPDVGFEWSVNPYRGCEHGCIYCYARPTHEYLGFSAGLDFETRILVKEDLPELLRAELISEKWKPQTVVFSGVTDCYQPVERRLRLTRRCIEVLAEFRNPVAVITKSALVERDADVLGELARIGAAGVALTITTLDEGLASRLEPRAATPRRRLNAIRALAASGIPVRVMAAPVIPGLTDHELPSILKAAADAGARTAGYTLVRLPYAVAPLFDEWLEREVPGHRAKVLHRIESARGGKRNDPRFGTRMLGEGPVAREISELFAFAKERAGLETSSAELSTAHFRRPGPRQQTLF